MSETLQSLDRDDRKELYYLLDKLNKHQRIVFLQGQCRKNVKAGIGATVTQSTGETKEVWGDLLGLAGVYGADMKKVLVDLSDFVRRCGY